MGSTKSPFEKEYINSSIFEFQFPMKIVILTPWYAENMGYAENFLPKAIAALGYEVHVVTSNVKPYFNNPLYEENYKRFLGDKIVKCEVTQIDGYTLHRLHYSLKRQQVYIPTLFWKLNEIKPDIVQSLDCFDILTQQALFAKTILGYKLFLECHVHASVFPFPELQSRKKKSIKSQIKSVINFPVFFYDLVYDLAVKRFLSYSIEKCYAISTDSADIAIRFAGIDSQKVFVSPLGVDMDTFGIPSNTSKYKDIRQNFRHQLGFSDSDVVCIYTGRFSEDKQPLYLAKAIDTLSRQGKKFRALFVGDGSQDIVYAINSCLGCLTHSFVPVQDLAKFYYASDIGVWPKQESTSQLDAMACSLPLILSDKVQVYERLDGNGLTYEEGNITDLANKIESLSDINIRQEMGRIGFQRIKDKFSWQQIAQERMLDYITSLG